MHINSRKMADGVDIDLYADDLDQGFPIKVSKPYIIRLVRFSFLK